MPYALAERECDSCGTPFVPHAPTGRFCSRDCYVDHKKATAIRGAKPVVQCKRCGDSFKQMGPRQLHCRKPQCHWQDHIARVLEPWQEAQDLKVERSEQRAALRSIRRIMSGEEQFGSPEWRGRREAEQRKALKKALAGSDELSELVAEQDKDGRVGMRVPIWEMIVSFDDRTRHPAGELDSGFGGLEKHEYIGGDYLRDVPL